MCFLSVVACKERPISRSILTTVAKIIVIWRQCKLEIQAKTTGLLVYLYIRDRTVEIFFIVFDWHVTILIVSRNTETRACNDVFRIACNERRSVVTSCIRQLNDLCCLEILQVDTCNTWCIVSINEQPTTIIHCICL